jgi:peptide maturation system protein (TIGR04066 family)
MHQKLIPNMEIVSLVSPKGWGLEGDVIAAKDFSITVHCDFTASLNDCTTVWFVEDGFFSLPDELLSSKIKEAVENNKKIICTRYKDHNQSKEMGSLAPPESIVIPVKSILDENFFDGEKLYDINVPVIFVLGTSENTDKFAVQVTLREQFLKRGYCISSISTRRDSEILGLHSIPDFMMESNFTEKDKILKYNHFVKQLEIEEKPEIIIIGIPGGALPFNRKLHNDFGIMAFEISNALKCDCAVLCSLCADYSSEYFDGIALALTQKYGINKVFHHLAATMKDGLNDTLNENEFSFLSLNEEFVKGRIKDIRQSDVYYALDEENAERMAEDIIEYLSNADMPNLL